MIKKASGHKTINLLQTISGIQIEGLSAWEQIV